MVGRGLFVGATALIPLWELKLTFISEGEALICSVSYPGAQFLARGYLLLCSTFLQG